MKVPPSLPSLTDARRAVEVARAMLAAWIAPVCRGHVYPIQVRRGHHVYRYYTWERCINGRRVQRTVRLDQVERITAGIRAMAGLQARLDDYCAACETLALVECSTPQEDEKKKRPRSCNGRTSAGRRHGAPP